MQTGLTFLVPAYPGYPGKEAVKRMSVCLPMSTEYNHKVHKQQNKLTFTFPADKDKSEARADIAPLAHRTAWCSRVCTINKHWTCNEQSPLHSLHPQRVKNRSSRCEYNCTITNAHSCSSPTDTDTYTDTY